MTLGCSCLCEAGVWLDIDDIMLLHSKLSMLELYTCTNVCSQGACCPHVIG